MIKKSINIYVFLLILLNIFSCSGIKPLADQSSEKETQITEEKQVVVEPKIEAPLVNSIFPVELKPGKVTYVKFPINLADGKWEMTCKGKTIPFVVGSKEARLLMVENYFSNLKPYKCLIDNVEVLDISVKEFPYKSERLNVNKKHVELSAKDLARHKKEKAILKEIYKQSASYYLFDKPFKRPLNSYVTSYYGNRRIFNNKKRSQHLGNDLRAAVGVPIPVANKGKVVFTGHLFFSGKMVLVDHGLNIYTWYGHLSKIKVTPGMVVNQGDIVGLAGATGRVSGPHLHWGVKINDHNIDGFSLVDESRKMFNDQQL